MDKPQDLKSLHEQSGMSFFDFADCLGVGYTNMTKFFNGKRTPPLGLIGDAVQLLANIEHRKSVHKHDPQKAYYWYMVMKYAYEQIVVDTTTKLT